MADTQEAMELLPTEATHAESESGETQDDVNGDEAPEEDARAQDETAEAETQQEAESEPQADADAEQPTDDQAESEAPAGDTQETAEAQADEAGTEEPMPDVTEAEAEADAEAAGDAEGRTALADQAVEEDQGPPEHRKLREAIRAIMAASDMDKLTASEIRKKLKPSFDKKYIKEQKSYIKQFVLDEIKKLQDEGGGAEDEAEEAPDNEAEGEYEGIQDQGMEDDNDSDYEKPAPRSSKKDSKARKRKLKRSSNDDDDEDDDGKPSKRRKKSTKDVKIQGPAGPKPAYFIFAAEHRDALREEYPDVSVKDLNSKLSERWKQISTSEKAEYEKKAKQDQQRYAAEMRAFKESNPEQHDLFIKQKK